MVIGRQRSDGGRRSDFARLRREHSFRGAQSDLRPGQRLTGTGMMASMGPGLPFAIAGQLAYPDRQSVAMVGDGGFAMLMAEMTTAVQHKPPVKIILLKNNTSLRSSSSKRS